MSLRRQLSRVSGIWQNTGTCHGASESHSSDAFDLPRILIVGNPNVGKSVIFNCLTGMYATISNYPGTTVEVFRGKTAIGRQHYSVVDTPGLYSLLPITEEERVARQIIFSEKSTVVLNVVDACNLERMLPLTLQLTEAGLPVILDVNLIDESRKLGIMVDTGKLEAMLGIPVVATAATKNMGIDDLKERIRQYSDVR